MLTKDWNALVERVGLRTAKILRHRAEQHAAGVALSAQVTEGKPHKVSKGRNEYTPPTTDNRFDTCLERCAAIEAEFDSGIRKRKGAYRRRS